MKTAVFILISILIHLSIGGVFLSLHEAKDTSLNKVIDLTLQAPLGLTSEKTAASPKPASRASAPPSFSQAPGQTADDLPSSETEDVSTEAAAVTPADGAGAYGDGAPVGAGEVTRLPKVLSEVKAAYPAEAKQARVDGPVILDVVIDRHGKVREVRLVRGPGYGLNESAMEALKKFEFRPAQKGDTTVAVKIRYTYRFKLGIN